MGSEAPGESEEGCEGFVDEGNLSPVLELTSEVGEYLSRQRWLRRRSNNVKFVLSV